MQDGLAFPVARLRDEINADKEFRLAARYWDAAIRFSIDQNRYFMRVQDGEVVDFTAGTQGFDPYTIDIGASADVWAKMLQAVPPAYHQSFLPAQLFHGLNLGGDLRAVYAHYAALERILVVMRRCHNVEHA